MTAPTAVNTVLKDVLALSALLSPSPSPPLVLSLPSPSAIGVVVTAKVTERVEKSVGFNLFSSVIVVPKKDVV